jgi:tetratricopeptide (TPR) repeat protein
MADMRVLTCLTAALLGAAVMLAQLPAASAQGSVQADQSWQTWISVTTPPDDKVAACSAVIDAKRETGSKLAAAYCFRGHGLTEKRQYDAALSDLNESIKLDPTSACALTNRGRVYAFKRDLDRAMADYNKALQYDPADAYSWSTRGLGRMQAGKAGATADFRKALELSPGLNTAREGLQRLGAAQ